MMGKIQFFRIFSLAALLCVCDLPALAKDLPRYGIFVYSNICKSAMSGDLYGNRITLRRLIDGDSLIYEYTDGSTHIVIADNLVFDSASGKISFEVHADGNAYSLVSGQVSRGGDSLNVRGTLFNEEATVTLKRTVNLGLPLQDCKK